MNDMTLLRMPEVRRMVGGVARSTIYDWQRRHNFPRGAHIGDRTLVFRKASVLAWIAQRM
jgi:predicted DNA-binding transcriptional regulator AlpA